MIVHSKNRWKRGKKARRPDRSHRFCYSRSFRLHIQFGRVGELLVDSFFNITLIRSADEIFGCFISYFRAPWHFGVLPRWPSPTFLLHERRNYSYVLPRYIPLFSEIVYPPQYNHPRDKQIPSLPYDRTQRYASLPRKWINFILGCGGRSSLL